MEINSKSLELIVNSINRYCGGTIDQAMGMLEDKLVFWRWNKRIEYIEEANKLLEKRGLSAPNKRVPPKLMLPLLDAAILEDDQELREKWTFMLANSADTSCPVDVKRCHVSLLENMTKFDARLFDTLAQNEVEKGINGEKACVNMCDYPNLIPNNDSGKIENPSLKFEVETSLNNLIRLGLLYNETAGATPYWVRLSSLGKEFYHAIKN